MPVVRIDPLGDEIEVDDGEPVAVAAWRLGYRWPTVCWGQAQCLACRAEVIDGELMVDPPAGEELDALRRGGRQTSPESGVRLGCRLTVVGEGVVVRKDGVRRPDRDE